MNQFSMPKLIRANKAIVIGSFKTFYEKRDILLSSVLPIRYNEKAIESTHNIICSTFLKLTNAFPDSVKYLLAQIAVSTSNDLYGKDTVPFFE